LRHWETVSLTLDFASGGHAVWVSLP
jgi:hypothetical protein